jgi:hypothetical protein
MRTSEQVLRNPDDVKSAIESALPGKRVELVHLDGMTFDEQMKLMRRTRVLVGPHGAGLALLLYLPKGAGIVEATSHPPPYGMKRSVAHIFWQYVSVALVSTSFVFSHDNCVWPPSQAYRLRFPRTLFIRTLLRLTHSFICSLTHGLSSLSPGTRSGRAIRIVSSATRNTLIQTPLLMLSKSSIRNKSGWLARAVCVLNIIDSKACSVQMYMYVRMQAQWVAVK